MVSEIFDADLWSAVPGFNFTDITYHRANDVPAVRVAFNRPEIRNAFRPHTVDEALCLRVARAQVQIARKLVGGGIGLLALYVAEAEIEGLELCLDRCGEG